MQGNILFYQNVYIKFIERTATILCKENTHFAVLTRQSYQNILSVLHNQSKNEHLIFLQNMSIFKGWSLGNIEQLYYQFIVQKYPKNHIFFKEGESSNFIYFIRFGEIEVVLILKNF